MWFVARRLIIGLEHVDWFLSVDDLWLDVYDLLTTKDIIIYKTWGEPPPSNPTPQAFTLTNRPTKSTQRRKDEEECMKNEKEK